VLIINPHFHNLSNPENFHPSINLLPNIKCNPKKSNKNLKFKFLGLFVQNLPQPPRQQAPMNNGSGITIVGEAEIGYFHCRR